MLSASPPSPPAVDRCDYFADVQLWPIHQRIDPREWLRNFEDDERPFAYDLLNAFLYFNDALIDELLITAVQRLGQQVIDLSQPAAVLSSAWRDFIETAVFTLVTGEMPSPADSGYAYVRKVRNVLGIREEQLLTPDRTLAALLQDIMSGRSVRPVIFVDDFVGSGNQFIETWQRQYLVPNVMPEISFDIFSSVHGGDFFYCPLVCTSYGASKIEQSCPQVVLAPAHMLSDDNNALHPSSTIFSPERKDEAEAVLRNISARVGMPDTGGADVDDWQGFHALGLCLAIGDSIPDACLGVFRWENNGWIPLFKIT